MTERNGSSDEPDYANFARTVAEAYIEEVRRLGLGIVDGIRYRQIPTLDFFVIVNVPRQQRLPGSRSRAGADYAKLTNVQGAIRHRFNHRMNFVVLSAPDAGERRIHELTRGTQSVSFDVED